MLDLFHDRRLRILVADDDPAIIDLFRQILAPGEPCISGSALVHSDEEPSGWSAPTTRFELVLCGLADEAVQAVREAMADGMPFCTAFIDVQMPPGRDGVWAAERIRDLDPEVQLVIISGSSDLGSLNVATRVPPADRLLYLQKPFHPQELRQLATSLSAKWTTERRSRSLQTDLMSLIEVKTNELSIANETLQQDMLEFERSKKMIVQAKMEWESTFDSVQDVVAILDRNLRLKRLNKSMARRLGIQPREAVGLSCSEAFDRPERPGEVSSRIAAMADRCFHTEELTIPRFGGDFLVTISPFFIQADGELVGTVIVAHDITRHKVLEAQLRQAQKMEAIGTLAGGIAHDFNNILGIIMGYTEMILDAHSGHQSETAMERRLRQVLQAGGRARDLVQQILTFSRQGDQELHPLRIGPLVKEILKLLRSTLPVNISVRQSIMPGQGVPEEDMVLAEPTQIQQIVMNLCTNAAHAMRLDGGTIVVSLAGVDLGPDSPDLLPQLTPGPYLRLTVEDSGHGIPPEHLERIFDPFFTTKKTGEGTGMGLSVVHGIVQRHKGAITVASQPGRGTVFHVLFPKATAGAAPAPVEEPPLPLGQGRILFVDDERALADIGQEMLEGLGYRVTAVDDSREALRLIQETPDRFDLIITDQAMPGLQGAELARRAMALRPDLPVILCTGYSESITQEKAREAGIRDFLMKPLLRRRLAESVSRVLGEMN